MSGAAGEGANVLRWSLIHRALMTCVSKHAKTSDAEVSPGDAAARRGVFGLADRRLPLTPSAAD